MVMPTLSLSRFLPVPATRRLAGAVLTLAANLLYARLFNRASPRGPLFVTWSLTYDCNAFCGFCATHKLHKEHPGTLDLARALAIADEIADSGTWVTGFTGGEVLLSPLLFPLVRRLKARGVLTYLVTNGLLLAEKAQEIVASGVDYVVVSLDSDDADQHDALRHSPGLMAKALNGIEVLKSLRKNGRPLIKASAIVGAHNLFRFEHVLDFLAQHADTVSAQPIVWGYKDHPHAIEQERVGGLLFPPDRRDDVERQFQSLAKHHPMFRSSYFRRMPLYWFKPENLIDAIPCWSPFLRLTIGPDGGVTQCSNRFGPVGDLTTEGLMSIWNGLEMRRQREVVRRRQNKCICWSQDTAFNDLMERLKLPNLLPAWWKFKD